VTQTPAKPNTPGRRAKPWPPRLFAAGAVLLLAVAGLAVVLTGGHGASGHVTAQDQANYASDALARINGLSALDGSRARDVAATLPNDLGADQVAALQKALADAQAQLKAALDGASLPPVPSTYVPGADLSADVGVPTVAAYPLPSLGAHLTVGPYVALNVSGTPAPGHDGGLRAPSTGNPTVDAALAQLLGACESLQGLVSGTSGLTGPVSSLPVGSVPVATPTLPADPCNLDGITGTPLPAPTGILNGIPDPTAGVLDPITGLLPVALPGAPSGAPDTSGQVQGADDTIAPDEAGAAVSQLHAGRILGAAGMAYSTTNHTLSDLLSTYAGLAAQLRDLIAAAHAAGDQATDAIPKVLDARLAAITEQVASLRADTERLVAGYESTVRAAAAAALGTAQDTLKQQEATLQATLDSDVASLNGQVKALTDLAADRTAAVNEAVRSATENLTAMAGVTGVDATQQVAAIRAAGDAAVKALAAQATAQVDALKQEAVLLQASAQAVVPRLMGLAQRAMAQVNATVADAVATADRTRSYLDDLATAQAAVLSQAERNAEAIALAKVPAMVAAYETQVKRIALDLTDSLPDVVASTDALVHQTSDLATNQVGKDLDYIAKVATDYSKVPTQDRMARADYWGTVDAAGHDALDTLSAQGDALDGLAAQVVSAAHAAHDAVEAVVAG